MSTAYLLEGRTSQKQRTRQALVDAARGLVLEGRTPTVEEAAEAASISRTTAYRYFPNQRALLVAAHPETEIRSLLPTDPPSDPVARFELALAAFLRLVLDGEQQNRTMLRLSLEREPAERGDLYLRQGRAIAWFEEALAPLRSRMTESDLRRLVLAIRSAIGIEAFVWLTDVAGLPREDAVALMRSSARTLLAAALPPSAE